jgi:hypothetical protein
MAAEVMAFADAFDASYSIKNDLQTMLRQSIPLLIMTDSRPLFDVIIRARYTTEKRLMVDLAAARQGFRKRDITNVCLIRSEQNVADAMTNFSANSSLLQLIKSHCINHPIEQCVLEYDRIHERAETSQQVREFLPESRTHSAQPHHPEDHSAQNV